MESCIDEQVRITTVESMSRDAQKQLLELSEELPAEKLREVIDFAQFLLSKSATRSRNGSRKPAKNLRKYVGGVKHGQLAVGIDDELYGRFVR